MNEIECVQQSKRRMNVTTLNDLHLFKCHTCGDVAETECKYHTLTGYCILWCGKEVTLDRYGNCPISNSHTVSDIRLKYWRLFKESNKVNDNFRYLFSTRLYHFRIRIVQKLYNFIKIAGLPSRFGTAEDRAKAPTYGNRTGATPGPYYRGPGKALQRTGEARRMD